MTAARRRTEIGTTARGCGLRHQTGRSGPALPFPAAQVRRTVQTAPGLAGTLPRGPLRLSAVAAVGIAPGSAASFLWIKV